jgi:hypothetical protein
LWHLRAVCFVATPYNFRSDVVPLLTVTSLISSELGLQIEGLSVAVMPYQTAAGIALTTAQLEAFTPQLEAAQLSGFCTWAASGGAAQLDIFSSVNGDSVALEVGMVVATYQGRMVRACAASQAIASVQGFVVARADVNLPVQVQCTGAISLPGATWNAVAEDGETQGLVPSSRYYLSTTPGHITSTPPSAPGTYLTPLGRSITPTTFAMRVAPHIQQ